MTPDEVTKWGPKPGRARPSAASTIFTLLKCYENRWKRLSDRCLAVLLEYCDKTGVAVPIQLRLVAVWSETGVEDTLAAGANPMKRWAGGANRDVDALFATCEKGASNMAEVILKWATSSSDSRGAGAGSSGSSSSSSAPSTVDINKKYQWDAASETRITCLHAAIFYHFHHTAKMLLRYGAAVAGDACLDSLGRTPLHFAVMHGCWRIIRPLLKAGADVHARDSHGLTPAEAGLRWLGEPVLARVNGKLAEDRTSVLTCLYQLQSAGHVSIACTLARMAWPIMNLSGLRGAMDLLLSFRHGGGQPLFSATDADDERRTALSLAAQSGKVQLVERLLVHHGVNATGDLTFLAWCLVSSAPHEQCTQTRLAEVYVAVGHDINETEGEDGYSALAYAVSFYRSATGTSEPKVQDAIRWLLNHGADPRAEGVQVALGKLPDDRKAKLVDCFPTLVAEPAAATVNDLRTLLRKECGGRSGPVPDFERRSDYNRIQALVLQGYAVLPLLRSVMEDGEEGRHFPRGEVAAANLLHAGLTVLTMTMARDAGAKWKKDAPGAHAEKGAVMNLTLPPDALSDEDDGNAAGDGQPTNGAAAAAASMTGAAAAADGVGSLSDDAQQPGASSPGRQYSGYLSSTSAVDGSDAALQAGGSRKRGRDGGAEEEEGGEGSGNGGADAGSNKRGRDRDMEAATPEVRTPVDERMKEHLFGDIHVQPNFEQHELEVTTTVVPSHPLPKKHDGEKPFHALSAAYDQMSAGSAPSSFPSSRSGFSSISKTTAVSAPAPVQAKGVPPLNAMAFASLQPQAAGAAVHGGGAAASSSSSSSGAWNPAVGMLSVSHAAASYGSTPTVAAPASAVTAALLPTQLQPYLTASVRVPLMRVPSLVAPSSPAGAAADDGGEDVVVEVQDTYYSLLDGFGFRSPDNIKTIGSIDVLKRFLPFRRCLTSIAQWNPAARASIESALNSIESHQKVDVTPRASAASSAAAPTSSPSASSADHEQSSCPQCQAFHDLKLQYDAHIKVLWRAIINA